MGITAGSAPPYAIVSDDVRGWVSGFACAVISTFAEPVPSDGAALSHVSSHVIFQCAVVEIFRCSAFFPASKFSEAGVA